MEAIKTPNDMSDKAKDWFQKNVFPSEEEVILLVSGEIVDFYQIMQSYAEQHLEDVLEEAEKEINNLYQPSGMHEFYTAGFEEGAKWLLNLLKQRKG